MNLYLFTSGGLGAEPPAAAALAESGPVVVSARQLTWRSHP